MNAKYLIFLQTMIPQSSVYINNYNKRKNFDRYNLCPAKIRTLRY